jgi:hypothetical protein
VDPFGRDEAIDFDDNISFYNDDEDIPESMDDDSNIEVIHKYIQEKSIKHGIKVMATPMGIIPVNDNTLSGKIFNFWMGHTNFDITKKVAETIEKTEGVESLDIYTRYRFRISVGKAFDDSFVMRNINKNVYKELSDVYQS